MPTQEKKKPWAVILAGGDGTRLQSLTQVISGDSRPKQFCPIFGDRTLLGETRARLARLFPPERTLAVLQDAHRAFYCDEFAGVDPTLVLSQPSNKGTAVAIAYAVCEIARRDPDAVIAFFPADHYYNDDAHFLTAVERASQIAARSERFLTLLGVAAYSPEVEYGWIEPASNRGEFSPVRRFWEKPSPAWAQELLTNGCLWNTFVMTGSVRAFLDLLRSSAPRLLEAVDWIVRRGGPLKADTRPLFSTIPPVDFSHRILSQETDRLLVFPVRGLRWSDLGKPERVLETLAESGIRPRWADSLSGMRKKATA